MEESLFVRLCDLHIKYGNPSFDGVIIRVRTHQILETKIQFESDELGYLLQLTLNENDASLITNLHKCLSKGLKTSPDNECLIPANTVSSIPSSSVSTFDKHFLSNFFLTTRTHKRTDNGEKCEISTITQRKSSFQKLLQKFPTSNPFQCEETLLNFLFENKCLSDEAEVRKIQSDITTLQFILTNLNQDEIEKYIGVEQYQKICELMLLCSKDMRALRTVLRNDEHYVEQELSDSELSLFIPWNKLEEIILQFSRKIIDNLSTSSYQQIFDAALCSLYVLDNPPRRNEYIHLSCIPGNPFFWRDNEFVPGDNWFYNGKIFLNKFKTAKDYGTYSFVVSKPTTVLLNEMVKRQPNKKYIFRQDTEAHINETKIIRKSFKRICGKPLHSTVLRVFFVSYMNYCGKISLRKEQIKLAYSMGHTVEEQKSVYTRRIDHLMSEHNSDAIIDLLFEDDHSESGEPYIENENNETNINETDNEIDIHLDIDENDNDDDDGNDDDMEVSEFVSDNTDTSVVSSSKRKKRTHFPEECISELNQLLGEFGNDFGKIKKKVEESTSALSCFNKIQIKQKAENEKIRRLNQNEQLDNFAVVVVRPSYSKRIRLPTTESTVSS